MIRIKIGEYEKSIDKVDKRWINQTINGYRKDGISVCVRVIIEQGSLNMTLSTPTCSCGSGGDRKPNTQEKAVFDLWDKRGLNTPEFNGGDLISFLAQLKRMF